MKLLNNFYLKQGIKGVAILSIVFLYSMCCFYWGNHDWLYLKDKASFSDTFFEARYSMHFFNILFFEGHILPIFVIFLLEVGFVFLGIISGIYLGVGKKSWEFLFFILLIGLFPYNLIVSYYLFIAVPLIWWAVFGVLLLFLTEQPFRWWKFMLGVMGYTLLFGSYPPNIALVMVLFCSKQIIANVMKNESEKLIIKKGIWWLGQFLGGALLFKVVLGLMSVTDGEMYNIKLYGLDEILSNIIKELFGSFGNLFLLKDDIGFLCSLFLILILAVSCLVVIFRAKNKLFVLLMILAMFVASRFMFIVSLASGVASFRGGYWGVLGLLIFALAVLNIEKKRWFKNLLYVFEIVLLICFIKIDFEAQKTTNLLFKSEIKFNERLKARIEENKNYNKDNRYMSLSIGGKSFINHFCLNGCEGYKNEVLSSLTMGMDLIPLMFFDDEEYKIHTKLGIWSGTIWRINDEKFFCKDALRFAKVDYNTEEISYWVYLKAKPWPHKNSLYVDENAIMLLLEDKRKYVEGKMLLKYLKKEY